MAKDQEKDIVGQKRADKMKKNRYYERCQSPKQLGDLSSDT